MNLVGGEQGGDLEQPRLLARFKFGHFRNTLVKIILRMLVYPIIAAFYEWDTSRAHADVRFQCIRLKTCRP